MIQENLKKGLLTEMKCQMFCIEQGWGVCSPLAASRYDFILDYKGKLLRVQVKTSRFREVGKSIVFNCRSVHSVAGGNKILPYTSDEIDYYMTTWENEFYLIPVTDCGTSDKTLRIIPIDSPQCTNAILLEQYKAEEVLSKLD